MANNRMLLIHRLLQVNKPNAAGGAAPACCALPGFGGSAFLSHVHHAYAQTDGTYEWPNSREGDMHRQAKREIETMMAHNAADGKGARVKLVVGKIKIREGTGSQMIVRCAANEGLEGLVAAFQVAINALVGKHGVGAPEKAKWYVVCPKGPDECGDVLGCIGGVGWKLDSANIPIAVKTDSGDAAGSRRAGRGES